VTRVLMITILVVLLAACTSVTGSGNLVSRQFDLDGFSRIDARNGAQVEVTRGDEFSVDVEVDDNVASELNLSVSGETLRIRLDVDSQINVTFRIKVTMPELTGVTLDGGSSLRGELAGEDLAVNLNGGSQATVTGAAGRVTIDVNGGSRALLGDLAAGDVELTANGGSRIEINASGRVSGQANGGASITVAGSPTSVNVETDGGASLTTK
jgi:hypothetical protein